MNAITVELPLPPKGLHPNTRYRSKFAITATTKKARELAFRLARSALGRSASPRWDGAVLCAAWHFPTKRRHDDDNLTAWLKAYRDGIAEAGIVKNCDDHRIRMIPRHLLDVDAVNPRVVLTITKEDAMSTPAPSGGSADA